MTFNDMRTWGGLTAW